MLCLLKKENVKLSSNLINDTKEAVAASCLALAEKVMPIFHGRNPHTQFCCSDKRLSNGIRFIAKKHCCNKEITDQIQIFVLFVLS